MTIERTLSIIKPDAVAKNVIGQIYARFEAAGLKIVAAGEQHGQHQRTEAGQTRGVGPSGPGTASASGPGAPGNGSRHRTPGTWGHEGRHYRGLPPSGPVLSALSGRVRRHKVDRALEGQLPIINIEVELVLVAQLRPV